MKNTVLVVIVMLFGWAFILSMFGAAHMRDCVKNDVRQLEAHLENYTPPIKYPRLMKFIRFAPLHVSDSLCDIAKYPNLCEWLKYMSYSACLRYVKMPSKCLAVHLAKVYEDEMIFNEQERMYVILHEVSVILQQNIYELKTQQRGDSYIYSMVNHIWENIRGCDI